MELQHWDDSLSIGDAEIDGQHKQLLLLVAETWRSVEAGGDKAEVEAPLRRLCDYVIHHFATEEARMDPEAYSNYDKHIQEHIECSMAALDFLADFNAGKTVDMHEFLRFAQEWIITHVMGTDQSLGKFLRAEA